MVGGGKHALVLTLHVTCGFQGSESFWPKELPTYKHIVLAGIKLHLWTPQLTDGKPDGGAVGVVVFEIRTRY